MATLKVRVESLRGHVAVGQQEQDGVLPLDRPLATGGTGLGFNGGHLMLLGWGACFKSTLVAAAEAREIPVDRLALEISGELVDQPYRFASVHMSVDLQGPATLDEKEKLITIARKGCAVSNTLSRAVDMEVTLTG